MISVDILPAFEGDCILINLDGIYILIDSGREEAYNLFLRERLAELKNKGKTLELAILTHIDKDHIGGFLSLFSDKEMEIPIREFWYNTFHHLPQERLICRRGQKVRFADNRMAVSDAKQLTKLLVEKGIPWNSRFSYQAVRRNIYQPIKIGDAAIWVLNPDIDELSRLAKEWYRQTGGLQSSTVYEQDAAMESDMLDIAHQEVVYRGTEEYENELNFNDLLSLKPSIHTSPTNESSIVIIIEYSGKKMLFLGDASQKSFMHALDQWCHINNKSMEFDLIKVPHHASYRSTNYEFYEKFKANNFLISTNGIKYSSHPSKAVLAQIIKNNPRCNIIFNYTTSKSYSYYSNYTNIPSNFHYKILLSTLII